MQIMIAEPTALVFRLQPGCSTLVFLGSPSRNENKYIFYQENVTKSSRISNVRYGLKVSIVPLNIHLNII